MTSLNSKARDAFVLAYRGIAGFDVAFDDKALASGFAAFLSASMPEDVKALVEWCNEAARYFEAQRTDEDRADRANVANAKNARRIAAALATLSAKVEELTQQVAERDRIVAEKDKALAFIEGEATRANGTIKLNRDGGGQGRVNVATAMHHIEHAARAARDRRAS